MKQKKENKQKCKKKYPIFSFKYLLFDFVKITGAIPTLIYFRPKIYRYGKKEKVKGAIMMSNHVGFLDPVVLLVCAGIRRIWSLAASDLFVKKSRQRILCSLVYVKNRCTLSKAKRYVQLYFAYMYG